MTKQKFHNGDWVKIADDLGSSMAHFESGCEAIVIGSYHDQFGGGNTKSYTLHIKNGGECSWYEECQLTLIESGRHDKLKVWELEKEKEIKIKSDIDWIFNNGDEVIKSPHGASISTLAKCFGLNDMWGNNGEGFVYFQNYLLTMELATPYLEKSDKVGWLEYCETIKK